MHFIHCIHMASSHTHFITGSHDGFLISSLFISVRRDGIRGKYQESRSTECPSSSGNSGTGKRARRTESPDNQEEKKPKGSVGVSHLRRKIKIPVKKFTKPPIPETVGDDEQEDNQSNQGSAKPSLSSNEGNDHSGDEPDDEKYQQLEDRMKAMEIQKIPGLDFNDLGLISDVVIPPKFKVPVFAKYDGVSCPKLHLRSYVRKIQPHTTDNKLWIHFFQESLSGTQLEWYYQLENTKVHTWEELAAAFYKQYQYNADLAPTRTQLRGMSMGPKESFKGYAQKWRDMAGRVQPPLSDRELVDMFMGTLTGPFYSHLLGSSSSGFTDLILTGEC